MTLQPIQKRRTESSLWKEFETHRPNILGALLDALCSILRSQADTQPDDDRMADAVLWIKAGEQSLGLPPGSFAAARRHNQQLANASAVEQSALGPMIQQLVEDAPDKGWHGTISELADALHRLDPFATKRDDFPRTPKRLAGDLRRLKPALADVGITVHFGERTKRGYPVTLRNVESNDIENERWG